MTDVRNRPAYLLHVLVAELDRAAEQIVLQSHGITYARFLALLAVERLEPATQRDLARDLAVSEPAASRMVAALAETGLVEVRSVPGAGNRREVRLGEAGREVVRQGSDVLEGAFAGAMEAAGVAGEDVVALTTSLLQVLAPARTTVAPR